MDSKKLRNWRRKGVIGLWGLLLVFVLAGCSTKKNTAGTRFYHSLTARFNTLHNGLMAYEDGVEAQNKGHKDDYTQLLPMYVSSNRSTQNLGKGSYETTIEKCEKAIKVHSVKKRPQLKGNKKPSPKEKEFRERKEFNPYLYHAWLLMGDAQFRKGEFIEAASTYNYILRLYSTQPDITSIARARLARCYVALEWPYDAEDVFRKMNRDSMSIQGERERDNSYAAYLIETEQYKEAIPYLKNTIKHTRKKWDKARMNFLLGQLYRETEDNDLAYKSWSKVIRSNPPYELAFNARILQTEVMSKSKYKQMIARLKRMAKSDKNKNYLDQVYYAIGNIYLSAQDTAHCIGAWERGVKDAVQSGIPKAVLLLRLSQLYWGMEKYIDAARTYQACVSILDKEHDEYVEAERRSKILKELEPHLSAIKLQDSLQVLAQLDETELNAAIDRVIEALKKQEKEEEKAAQRKGMATGQNRSNNMGANTNANAQNNRNNTSTPSASNLGGPKGDWYFYNASAVSSGKEAFQKRWGQRKNEDNWRISNKAGLAAVTGDDAALNAPTDSLASGDDDALYGTADGEDVDDEDQAKKDSLANDPHHREYYMKQIPFTEEQMEQSNKLLSDGLYNAGIVEQEQLENFPLAEQTMLRLLNDFPEHDNLDNIYYHLFLLYGRLDNQEKAQEYKDSLLSAYPESRYAILVGNPNYEIIARYGKHMEDSIYSASYTAYQADDYAQVEANYQWSKDNFPEGTHRARMMFIRAMANLYAGERDTFMVTLKEVVQKYPKEEVTALASAIVKGLEEGRILMDDRYDASSIWSRRKNQSNDSTEVAVEMKDERYSNFAFVLAYPTNSLDEDKLLYAMARYNFTNYMVRNFEIELNEDQGISMMIVKGFVSYDEVHSYAQQLYGDKEMNRLLEGIRSLLISEENLEHLGTDFSFDDYKEFYDEKFAPLTVPNMDIDEPVDLEFKDPDEVDENEKSKNGDDGGGNDDDFPFGF